MQPLHSEECNRWKRCKKFWKYVDRSLVDLMQHQHSDWLISSALHDKHHAAPLYSLHRTFRKGVLFLLQPSAAVSANCFWWIVHHQCDVAWRLSDNSGLPCLCRVLALSQNTFGAFADVCDADLAWSKNILTSSRDTWCYFWQWGTDPFNKAEIFFFSTVTVLTNYRTLLGKRFYSIHFHHHISTTHHFWRRVIESSHHWPHVMVSLCPAWTDLSILKMYGLFSSSTEQLFSSIKFSLLANKTLISLLWICYSFSLLRNDRLQTTNLWGPSLPSF